MEANDTVNSRAMASVLDLLGEGVIGGLIDGAKSIFLNDTPLQNSDNSYNFSGVTWWFRDGSQDQSVIDGFDFIETPKSVGRQLKQTSQVNVSLDSADSDRVRVVMKFPSLRSIDKRAAILTVRQSSLNSRSTQVMAAALLTLLQRENPTQPFL